MGQERASDAAGGTDDNGEAVGRKRLEHDAPASIDELWREMGGATTASAPTGRAVLTAALQTAREGGVLRKGGIKDFFH
jgi:hypothetical protein